MSSIFLDPQQWHFLTTKSCFPDVQRGTKILFVTFNANNFLNGVFSRHFQDPIYTASLSGSDPPK